MWHLYILKTETGKFYTGITDNLDRRFQEHRIGKGGHYTKYDRPQACIYSEKFPTRKQAEAREQQIKRWTRAKKLALMEGKIDRLRQLSVSRD